MRCRIRRRSVSSFVSPGPRVPMPPPSRDSASLDPASRGSRYSQLREFDLQLAFVRAGAPGEDVENQFGAIHHAPAAGLLEIARLARRQVVVDDDEVRAGFLAGPRELLGLALPISVAGSALTRSCITRSTTDAPAASASPASSSSCCSGSLERDRRVTRPTSAARSTGGWLETAPRDLIVGASVARGPTRSRPRARGVGGCLPRIDDRRRRAAGRARRHQSPADAAPRCDCQIARPRSPAAVRCDWRWSRAADCPTRPPARAPSDVRAREWRPYRVHACTAGTIDAGASQISDSGPGQNASASLADVTGQSAPGVDLRARRGHERQRRVGRAALQREQRRDGRRRTPDRRPGRTACPWETRRCRPPAGTRPPASDLRAVQATGSTRRQHASSLVARTTPARPGRSHRPGTPIACSRAPMKPATTGLTASPIEIRRCQVAERDAAPGRRQRVRRRRVGARRRRAQRVAEHRRGDQQHRPRRGRAEDQRPRRRRAPPSPAR